MDPNTSGNSGIPVPATGSLFDIIPKPWEIDAPRAPPDFKFNLPEEPQWIKNIRDPYMPQRQVSSEQVQARRTERKEEVARFQKRTFEARRAALTGESGLKSNDGNTASDENDMEDAMEVDGRLSTAQNVDQENTIDGDVDMEDTGSLPNIRAKPLSDNSRPAQTSGGLKRRKQIAPSTRQRSTGSHRQRDIFDFPEDDEDEIPDSQSEGTSPQQNPPSSLPVNPGANTIVVNTTQGQSKKRKASGGLYGIVETIHGTKTILENIPGSKSVERLLQRGRIESPVVRIWFLCQFRGESAVASEPVLQTALKKNKRAASLITDWDKSHKG